MPTNPFSRPVYRYFVSLLLGGILVSLLVLVVSFFPIEESDDDWWHLKAGKLLWEGEIGWYSFDPFTQTAREKVWINHEWLAEWLFYAVARVGGLNAANLFKSLVLIAAFSVVYLSCLKIGFGSQACFPAAVLAVCLAIPTSQFTMYLRPPVWSFLLLSVYHRLILGSYREKKDRPHTPCLQWPVILLMAVLMVLWANLHGGAILGCVVILLMGVGSVIDRCFLPAFFQSESRTTILRWGLAVLLIGGASLLNPYGYHLHSLTFEVMSQKWLTERIFELAPPRIDLVWTAPLLLIPAALGVIRFGGWGERLVFVFLLWQGLSHVRHLPLTAIWAAPYAARVLSDPLGMVSRKGWLLATIPGLLLIGLSIFPGGAMPLWGSSLFRFFMVAILSVLALLVLLYKERRVVRWFIPGAVFAIAFVVGIAGQRPTRFIDCVRGTSWSSRNFPDKLADFILTHGIKTPTLFTRETGAGYLIWKLSPEIMRVFSCTRFDLQGSRPIKEIESMLWLMPEWTDPDTGEKIPGWETLWNHTYHFDVVLLEKYADPLQGRVFKLWDYLNQPSSEFVRVASEAWPGPGPEDRQWSLFMRRGPELSQLMREIGKPAWFDEK